MSNRRQFLTGMAAIGVVSPVCCFVSGDEKPERLDLKMVGQFVGKSHGDLESVTKLIAQEPKLVNAAWDWGNGDWETGLGAASHVGRKEIARLLLDNGARLDVFAATMLGMNSVVAEMLKVIPDLHSVRGPHGIPMLSHAIFGREDADEVFELLLSSGADVNASSNMNMTPLMAAVSLKREKIVEELLSRGADPTVSNTKGDSIMDVAKRRKNPNIIKLLEKALSQQ